MLSFYRLFPEFRSMVSDIYSKAFEEDKLCRQLMKDLKLTAMFGKTFEGRKSVYEVVNDGKIAPTNGGRSFPVSAVAKGVEREIRKFSKLIMKTYRLEHRDMVQRAGGYEADYSVVEGLMYAQVDGEPVSIDFNGRTWLLTGEGVGAFVTYKDVGVCRHKVLDLCMAIQARYPQKEKMLMSHMVNSSMGRTPDQVLDPSRARSFDFEDDFARFTKKKALSR